MQSYRDRGFPPEAVLNYIARLGWAHGDLEIFSQARAGRAVHARRRRLVALAGARRQAALAARSTTSRRCRASGCSRTCSASSTPRPGRPVAIDDGLRASSSTCCASAARRWSRWRSSRASTSSTRSSSTRRRRAKFLQPEIARAAAPSCATRSRRAPDLGPARRSRPPSRRVIERHGLQLGTLAQPVRVAITGGTVSPPIFETLAVLGRERSLRASTPRSSGDPIEAAAIARYIASRLWRIV